MPQNRYGDRYLNRRNIENDLYIILSEKEENLRDDYKNIREDIDQLETQIYKEPECPDTDAPVRVHFPTTWAIRNKDDSALAREYLNKTKEKRKIWNELNIISEKTNKIATYINDGRLPEESEELLSILRCIDQVAEKNNGKYSEIKICELLDKRELRD